MSPRDSYRSTGGTPPELGASEGAWPAIAPGARATPPGPPVPPDAPPASGPRVATVPPPVGKTGSTAIAIPPKAKLPAITPVVHSGSEDDDGELAVVVRRAPPWLISTIFHTALFIVLGLVTVAVERQIDSHEPEIPLAADIFSERIGDTSIDDSTLPTGPTGEDVGPQTIITPQDLPPVNDALAAPPKLADLSFGPNGTVIGSDIDAPEIGFALMGRERGSMKNTLIAVGGGNKTTQSAVDKGLEWLIKNQLKTGYWSLIGPYSDGSGVENKIAATAMALLALQGDGNTHLKGVYAKNVAHGWTYLLAQQNRDGDFASKVQQHQRLYSQAQATIALCELYGMTQDSRYREPAERAIRYAVANQDSAGGWRYTPGQDSDTSVTGWFVMALQSARMAKLEVPQETLDRVSKYLDSVQEEYGRRYCYRDGHSASLAITAEGLLCREYLGWKQNDPRLIDGLRALCDYRVSYTQGQVDVYYWYYATQAAHHMEGDIWKQWNERMRQEVPSHQTQNGKEAGSWDPQGDAWGSQAGRLYTTCLSIYMLEVYYRHLPIYSGYKSVAN